MSSPCHSNHLGSATWITNSANGLPVEFIHYLPFGELWYNQQASAYNERFKFTGKERDEETGYDYFGARNYTSDASIWLSPDPLSDKYPQISSYAYCAWNPLKYVDPDGRDEEQRETALNMARKFVEKNPGYSYELGEKGGPGEKVDCSGLISRCVIAGNEKDPALNGSGNGVRRIATNTQKIENLNNIVPGNLVTFNTGTLNGEYSHIGIITSINHDKEGNIIDFYFIHSGSSTGPIEAYSHTPTYRWIDKVTGFYKWDTLPEVYEVPMLPQVVVYGKKSITNTPERVFNVEPIFINDKLKR